MTAIERSPVALERPDHDAPPSAVSKALTLLELVAESERGSVSLTELALAAGLPKSSTHRLLRELQQHGLIERAGSKYRIGSRVFQLSLAATWTRHGNLRDVSAPILESLFKQTRMTVHLAVLEGIDVLYLEKITAPNGSGIPSRVGSRMPATCTALGKAMLAHSPPEAIKLALASGMRNRTPRSVREPNLLVEQLKAVHATGTADEHDESKIGLSCVAAPVLISRRPIAAVSVSGFRPGCNPTSYSSAVRAAAAAIAQRVEGA